MPLLNYREQGTGPTLICLHGLYGYGRNWAGLARALPDWRVILPDLRNHGQSFHSPEATYAAMAQDLAELVAALKLESFSLLGHSMGGKVAMQYALAFQPTQLRHLIGVDVAPKAYATREHEAILKALSELDLSQVHSRQDAEVALASAIPALVVRRFLVSNLRQGERGWEWQFNLPVLREQIGLIAGTIETEGAFQACPVLFVSGGRSDYLRPEDHALVLRYFPQARFEVVPQAGHWLHVEAPQAFQYLIADFLKS